MTSTQNITLPDDEDQSLVDAIRWGQWAARYNQVSALSNEAMDMLREVQRDWPVYRPHVLGTFEVAAAELEQEPPSDEQCNLFCAMGYLLAVARDPDGFASVQRIALAPAEHRAEFMGDMEPEMLPAWLAAFCHQDLAKLDWLRDLMLGRVPGASWSVQSSAQDALLRCCAHGLVQPEALGGWLKERCEMWVALQDSGPWTDPQDTTDVFSPGEYLSYSIMAWQDAYFTEEDLTLVLAMRVQAEVDDFDHTPEDIETSLRESQARAANPASADRVWPAPWVLGLPSNIEIEIRRVTIDHDAVDKRLAALRASSARTPEQALDLALPYMRLTAKVGRNEPCPCGSGAKYKKCCGKG